MELARLLYAQLTRLTDFVAPLGNLVIRLYVANVFFKSGLTKIESWDATLYLFTNEYHVALLPPPIAAVMGTFTELVFPVLLALGIATRFTALWIFAFNVIALASYPFLWTEDGQVGFTNHVVWGLLLLVPLLYGAGTLSVDHVVSRRFGR
jgi:putative oxidoreductase